MNLDSIPECETRSFSFVRVLGVEGFEDSSLVLVATTCRMSSVSGRRDNA